MKIVFVASEAAPFIKTGGLGDVAKALPEALSKYKGNDVLLFLPYYSNIKKDVNVNVECVASFTTKLSWRDSYVGLMKYKNKRRKLRIYFIDNEYYFGRGAVYGELDDGERFAFFCKAVLESLVYLGETPEIIHCNDWQTALIPAMLHAFYADKLGRAKTVFTIHNIEYQGWAHPYFLCDVTGLPEGYENTFAFGGSVNFVKGAILSSDALTTVSRTYADEICYPYFAHGLSSVICDHKFKTVGIVNGIDTLENDPQTDKDIAKNYGVSDYENGKAVCKSALQEYLGLPIREDVPLIGVVTRLVSHKGLDILCEAIDKMMEMDLQFVILGTGDAYYENKLACYAAKYSNKLSFNLKFSTSLASKIYSAADMYLMPSKSEPCGLSQMIAMRYGAIPIVHETGGLKDTVKPFDITLGYGTGFTFKQFNSGDMLDALCRALEAYKNKDLWNKITANAMNTDLSWDLPAAEYMELYEKITTNA